MKDVRTTKPISTISYNSPAFLQLKLDELRKAGRLSFWAFIRHQPEDDEGGKKYHMHVYIEPSKMLQTDDLRGMFKEFDPENPENPKGVLKFNNSKFGDWYLYALHDRRYLAQKGQSRRYTYRADEFITSDADDLNCMVKSIDLLSLSPYSAMEDAISQGVTWEEYFSRGTVPIPLVRQWQIAYLSLMYKRTDRNGRPGHEGTVSKTDTDVLVDTKTGEVISHAAKDVSADRGAHADTAFAHEDRGDVVVSAADPGNVVPGVEGPGNVVPGVEDPGNVVPGVEDLENVVSGVIVLDEDLISQFIEETGLSRREAIEILTGKG